MGGSPSPPPVPKDVATFTPAPPPQQNNVQRPSQSVTQTSTGAQSQFGGTFINDVLGN